MVDWRNGADKYKAALNPADVRWVYHCIGLLMSKILTTFVFQLANPWDVAAIPIRDRPEKDEVSEEGALIRLYPTLRNPNANPITILPNAPKITRTCPESELFDPLNKGDQQVYIAHHTDYIDVLRGAISVVAGTNVPVSQEWLYEILRVADSLELQRAETKKELLFAKHPDMFDKH
ncbi:hypothetical protein F4808DRAFT_459527 [Astrocystis sublimbata]|nr:hypothetical protein F4808DRAFT_459527 [Astrocystis sublimbata]